MNKKIIHTVFEQNASRFPDRVAVKDSIREITYTDLNKVADMLRSVLIHLEVDKTQAAVGVAMASGVELVAAQIAIFKARGIYLPLNVNQPKAKLRHILRQCNPKVLILRKADEKEINELLKEPGYIHEFLVMLGEDLDIEVFQLEGESKNRLQFDSAEVKRKITIAPDDGNYIFYTSGSTGDPKAILGCHKSLAHFIDWEINEFGIDDTCKVSQLSSITFDASLRDIWVPLCAGGTLFIPAEEVKSNTGQLVHWISENGITLVHTVPSVLRLLVKELAEQTNGENNLDHLKYLMLSGEQLFAKDIRKWRTLVGDHVNIVNLYGPTETTMVKTFYKVGRISEDEEQRIPAGKPMSNTLVAVINDGMPCKTGEIGEVYIKTPFATKGYLFDTDLQSRVFVQNPLVKDKEDIVYKTGDLGRLLESGDLEILGRTDNQVKVNGIRLELNEVEAAFLSLKGVEEVVVLPHTSKDYEVSLVSYYTGQLQDVREVRALLQNHVESVAIPRWIIHMDALPLNINGKVDKRALPKPEVLIIEEDEYEAVQGETEHKIEQIWKAVLGLQRIGRKASFFNIGGNSLKAIQMISRIYKEFGVMILVKDIFSASTIDQLAVKVDQSLRKEDYEDITPVALQPHYELSHAQKRLWIMSRYEQSSTAFNIHNAYEIKGDLNVDVFQRVMKELVQRHEVLRTTLITVNNEPRQRVSDHLDFDFSFSYKEISKNSHNQITSLVKQEAATVFDLEKGPLVRFALFKCAEHSYVFSFTLHHIISDAWSLQLLINEAFELYNAYINGSAHQLPPLKIQYKDFAHWQNALLSDNSKIDEHKAFWLENLSGDLPVLDLPIDFPRPVYKTYNGGVVKSFIEQELMLKLEELSKKHDASLFMTLLCTVNLLLFKYTGQDDLIIGTPVAGREHPDLENQVGFYINNLALRSKFSGNDSFDALLEKVKAATLDAFDHQLYPFDRLVEDLNIPRVTDRSPLYDVALVLLNIDIQKEEHEMAGISLDTFDSGSYRSALDIRMVFEESQEGYFVMFEYNSDLFREETIQQMIRHFKQLIPAATNAPTEAIGTLNYLADDEINDLLCDKNNTVCQFNVPEHIPSVFENQVRKSPEANAIIYNDKVLTYQEVNEQANSLAFHLRNNLHVKPNDVVALMAPANDHAVVAALAIMKAGAAYLPVDPELPVQRKAYILQNAEVKLLLTEMEMLDEIVGMYQGEIFALDIQWPDLKPQPQNLPLVNKPSDIAYVIYTSGSTGKPKGVAVSHESQVNMSMAQVGIFNITADDHILQFASLSFDASISEIFMALYSGATLVLKDKNIVFDIQNFIQYLRDKKVSVVTFPPSFLSTLPLDQLHFLRVLITAGEAANVSDLTYLSQFVDCYNAYGPTECAVCVSTYKVTRDDKEKPAVPIGRPIANTKVYILDDHQRLVPKGVSGTLYVSGKGLANGYLNNKELTSASFVDNPFEEGTKMYCTGDRAKWSHDGELLFLGRTDDQLKINGHRVELGEIESCLISHEKIKDAYVTSYSDKDDSRYMAAYYVALDGLSSSALKEHATNYLPGYLVPSYFIEIEKLPLNNNGKVDAGQLPHPQNERQSVVYVEPQNETQKILVEIWESVLGRENIGIRNNFFDLGGHSLKAIQILAEIADAFRVKPDLASFFNAPTVEAVSQLIESSEVINDDLKAVDEQDFYETTNAQRRLWVLDRMNPGFAAYNLPLALSIQGELNVQHLSGAFDKLIDRHESLRTTFHMQGGVLKQKIETDSVSTLEYVDLRKEENSDIVSREMASETFEVRFDLGRGPLLKIRLLHLEKDKYLLLFNMHHIIGDEWSMAVMVRELMLLYSALKDKSQIDLPELRVQYKDFAAWQNHNLNSGAWEIHKDYWLNMYNDPVSKIDFAVTNHRPEYKTYNGNVLNLQLGNDISQKITQMCKTHEASLFMTLYASLCVMLNKYTGLDDVIIGTPVALRSHRELQHQIGLYLNLLALRTRIDDQQSFSHLLQEIRRSTLEAFAHQEYPFDRLVEDLKLSRDLDRSPLFDIMMVLHDEESEDQALPQKEGLSITQLKEGTSTSRYDMTFHFRVSEGDIAVSLEYNTDLFPEKWVGQFLIHYKSLIQQLLAHHEVPVGSLEYLLPSDRQRLLEVHNQIPSEYIANDTIISLFEKQVRKTPDSKAIQFENISLSYDEVNRLSNQVAHYLKDQFAIEQDDLVCLLMDRSEKMMIALLGILKTGAAYVPIAIDYPVARINFILKDTKAKCLILDDGMMPDLDLGNCKAITPGSWNVISKYSPDNLTQGPSPTDLAYVIYTSGSTGIPKGVMVEHQGVVNRLGWMWDEYDFTTDDVILQKTNYVFDVSVWELFMPLMYGARQILCRQEVIYDVGRLASCMADFGVTTIHFVPGMLQIFLQGLDEKLLLKLSGLKRVICSGEALPVSVVHHFHEKLAGNLYNLYGPTEASIDVSHYQTQPYDQLIPIGKPISNTQLYVLDGRGHLQPEGVPGEIAIGGVGLARGYLNRQDLTSEKFVTLDMGTGKKQRIYLTGDLGHWMADGNIVYHGRIDNQVKVHGQRIELGEIENVLLNYEEIKSAVASTIKTEDATKIAAYYLSDSELEAGDIKAFLSKYLPSYMLPTFYIRIEKLPLTTNGKIDRRSLPQPSNNHLVINHHYKAPQSALQERLVAHWQMFLGDINVGIEDNFFDLGGNSLKLILLHEKLKQEFPEIEVIDLFKYPSIGRLSSFLEDTSMMEVTGLEV